MARPTIAPKDSVPCNRAGDCMIAATMGSGPQPQQHVPHSSQQSLQFWYRAPQGQAPTLVIFPGGPGDTVVANRAQWLSRLSVPQNFGVLLMDGRGLGQNDRAVKSPVLLPIPYAQIYTVDTKVNSSTYAADVHMALAAVRAKSVVIYGVSYGSVPALMLAHRLETQSPSQMIHVGALLLDGAIQSAEPSAALGARLVASFDQTLSELSPIRRARVRSHLKLLALELKREFSERPDQLEIQRSDLYLGLFLQAILIDQSEGSLLDQFIELASSPTQVERLKQFVLQNAPRFPTREQASFFRSVGCQDLFTDGVPQLPLVRWDIESRKLIPTERSTCLFPHSTSSVASFSSNQYRVKAPILYFSGGRDIATPRWNSITHALSQSLSLSLVEIYRESFGHGVFRRLEAECQTEVWWTSEQLSAWPLASDASRAQGRQLLVDTADKCRNR